MEPKDASILDLSLTLTILILTGVAIICVLMYKNLPHFYIILFFDVIAIFRIAFYLLKKIAMRKRNDL